jgi:hypothetical protein
MALKDRYYMATSSCGSHCSSNFGSWPWQTGGCSSSGCGDDDCSGDCSGSKKCKDCKCDNKEKETEPKNNDGRDECYWCWPREKTEKIPGLNRIYNICPRCKK